MTKADDGYRDEAEIERVRQVVRSLLLEGYLSKDALADVRVEAGEDRDGDPIYWIAVVLERGKERIDAGKTLSFVRHLREKMGSDAFPIMSYISKSDAKNLKRAIA